jgi:hypothetical protein
MQQLTQEQLDDLAIIFQTYSDFMLIENPKPEQERRKHLALELLEAYHQRKLTIEYTPNDDKYLIDAVQTDCPRFNKQS